VAKYSVQSGEDSMSKIGRKPISIKDVQVDIDGDLIRYKGKKATGQYKLPHGLKVEKINDQMIRIMATEKSSDINRLWGLHRALLANKLRGADIGFEEQLQIIGLGFKAVVSGRKVVFSLGYSHKIDFDVPEDVTLEADSKAGQNLTVKGLDKERVGLVADQIRSLRPPEPYKGTGIKLKNETIRRKAGKTKRA
jgi:large subunit ribosomal protein L6